MRRKRERANETLGLRSAYARLRHWTERLAAANANNNDELAAQASRFVTEYQDFIRELEQQTDVQAIATVSSSLPSAVAVTPPLATVSPLPGTASLASQLEPLPTSHSRARAISESDESDVNLGKDKPPDGG